MNLFPIDHSAINREIEKASQQISEQFPNPIVENSERSATSLEKLIETMELNREEQKVAQRSAKKWQFTAIIIGVLTLIATVVGIFVR